MHYITVRHLFSACRCTVIEGLNHIRKQVVGTVAPMPKQDLLRMRSEVSSLDEKVWQKELCGEDMSYLNDNWCLAVNAKHLPKVRNGGVPRSTIGWSLLGYCIHVEYM